MLSMMSASEALRESEAIPRTGRQRMTEKLFGSAKQSRAATATATGFIYGYMALHPSPPHSPILSWCWLAVCAREVRGALLLCSAVLVLIRSIGLRPQQRNLVCLRETRCASCAERRAHSDAPSHVAGDPRELSGDEHDRLRRRGGLESPSS